MAMWKYLLITLSLAFSINLTAQTINGCDTLINLIQAMDPSTTFEAWTANYALICSENNGQVVGRATVQEKFTTLEKAIAAYKKVDYRLKDGSDYGLWDYSVVYKGDQYAILHANQAVNSIVTRTYYFQKVE